MAEKIWASNPTANCFGQNDLLRFINHKRLSLRKVENGARDVLWAVNILRLKKYLYSFSCSITTTTKSNVSSYCCRRLVELRSRNRLRFWTFDIWSTQVSLSSPLKMPAMKCLLSHMILLVKNYYVCIIIVKTLLTIQTCIFN